MNSHHFDRQRLNDCLMAAVNAGIENVVELLLELGADPCYRPGGPMARESALELAAEHGKVGICRALVLAGADPTSGLEPSAIWRQWNTAFVLLALGARARDVPRPDVLAEQHPNVNLCTISQCEAAVRSNDLELLRLALQAERPDVAALEELARKARKMAKRDAAAFLQAQAAATSIDLALAPPDAAAAPPF